VSPGDRGRGIARRALMLLSRWALAEARFVRLDLQAAVANVASIRVAESCGFVREGTLREAWYRGPERTDMALFSLLRADAGPTPG
jgi:RimJ/RimL family protein N-acetyltransferase